VGHLEAFQACGNAEICILKGSQWDRFPSQHGPSNERDLSPVLTVSQIRRRYHRFANQAY
jgi:hypothetical protein